jgi:hypothetical protein
MEQLYLIKYNLFKGGAEIRINKHEFITTNVYQSIQTILYDANIDRRTTAILRFLNTEKILREKLSHIPTELYYCFAMYINFFYILFGTGSQDSLIEILFEVFNPDSTIQHPFFVQLYLLGINNDTNQNFLFDQLLILLVSLVGNQNPINPEYYRKCITIIVNQLSIRRRYVDSILSVYEKKILQPIVFQIQLLRILQYNWKLNNVLSFLFVIKDSSILRLRRYTMNEVVNGRTITVDASEVQDDLDTRAKYLFNILYKNQNIENLYILDGHGRFLFYLLHYIFSNTGLFMISSTQKRRLVIHVVELDHVVHEWHEHFFPKEVVLDFLEIHIKNHLGNILDYLKGSLDNNDTNSFYYLNFCSFGTEIPTERIIDGTREITPERTIDGLVEILRNMLGDRYHGVLVSYQDRHLNHIKSYHELNEMPNLQVSKRGNFVTKHFIHSNFLVKCNEILLDSRNRGILEVERFQRAFPLPYFTNSFVFIQTPETLYDLLLYYHVRIPITEYKTFAITDKLPILLDAIGYNRIDQLHQLPEDKLYKIASIFHEQDKLSQMINNIKEQLKKRQIDYSSGEEELFFSQTEQDRFLTIQSEIIQGPIKFIESKGPKYRRRGANTARTELKSILPELSFVSTDFYPTQLLKILHKKVMLFIREMLDKGIDERLRIYEINRIYGMHINIFHINILDK